MKPTKKPSELGKAELLNKIREDIEKTGFSAEMKVNRILLDYSLDSIQPAQTYLDKDSQLSREIDFVAFHCVEDDDFTTLIIINLIIEVKKSTNPWVVFYKKSDIPNSFHFSSEDYNYHLKDISNPPVRNLKKELHSIKSPLLKSKILGTAFHEALKNKSDKELNSQIYGALMSSCKATIHQRELDQEEEEINQDYEPTLFTIVKYYLPLIVLDGLLYKSSLDDEGNILVEESSYIPISLSYSSANYVQKGAETFYPEIVTIDGLKAYLDELLGWQKQVLLKTLEIKKKKIPPIITSK